MRSVQRWRHYCEFCRRGMFIRPRMVKHEQVCTLNINRVCGVCGLMDNEQVPTAQLMADLTNHGYAKLRESASECPACILAAIRLATLALPEHERFGQPDNHWRTQSDAFNFKAAMQEVWKEFNEQRAHEEGPY